MQIDVIFGILLTLLDKRKVSSRELSLKYEISTRTVFRYIDVISAAGVPLYTQSGVNGGIMIMDNYKLDRLFFTQPEMMRLITSVKSGATAFNDGLSERILEKLNNLSTKESRIILQSERLIVDSAPWGDVSSFSQKMRFVENAVQKDEVISIVYHARDRSISTRDIEPHSLVLKEGLWYVYAYCLLRNEFRLFKIGRIKSVASANKKFVRRQVDIEDTPYNKEWYSEVNTINLVMEVSADIRFDVEEWLGVECVRQNNGETIYAIAKVPDDSGLIPKLLSFGNGLKIIEPISIRDKLKKMCDSIIKMYTN